MVKRPRLKALVMDILEYEVSGLKPLSKFGPQMVAGLQEAALRALHGKPALSLDLSKGNASVERQTFRQRGT